MPNPETMQFSSCKQEKILDHIRMCSAIGHGNWADFVPDDLLWATFTYFLNMGFDMYQAMEITSSCKRVFAEHTPMDPDCVAELKSFYDRARNPPWPTNAELAALSHRALCV